MFNIFNLNKQHIKIHPRIKVKINFDLLEAMGNTRYKWEIMYKNIDGSITIKLYPTKCTHKEIIMELNQYLTHHEGVEVLQIDKWSM